MAAEQSSHTGEASGDSNMLSRLLDPTITEQREWRQEELGAILRHRITEPVQFDLSRLPPGRPARLHAIASDECLILKNLVDLFFHPHPPIELLVMVKNFAKAHHESPESGLPEEVATTVYLASIVTALLRWGERITSQDNASLYRSLQWAVGQTWQDERLRALFKEGLAHLGSGEQKTS